MHIHNRYSYSLSIVAGSYTKDTSSIISVTTGITAAVIIVVAAAMLVLLLVLLLFESRRAVRGFGVQGVQSLRFRVEGL